MSCSQITILDKPQVFCRFILGFLNRRLQMAGLVSGLRERERENEKERQRTDACVYFDTGTHFLFFFVKVLATFNHVLF